MQKLQINPWLENQDQSLSYISDSIKELELDFSDVDEIRLNDVERLLDLQKLAVFNEVKIKTQNLKPSVSKIFEHTGLDKMLNALSHTRKQNIRKRQGFIFD